MIVDVGVLLLFLLPFASLGHNFVYGARHEIISLKDVEKHYTTHFDISHLLLQARLNDESISMTMVSTFPTTIRISKCDQTILQSRLPTVHDQISLQNSWIPFLLNPTKWDCDDDKPNQFQLEVFPNDRSNVLIKFRLAPRIPLVFDNSDTLKSVFEVNQLANTANSYKSSMPKAISTALTLNETDEKWQFKFSSAFSQPTHLGIGKCNYLGKYSSIFDVTETNITGHFLKSLQLFSDLKCLSDVGNSFESILTTAEHTTGHFAYELVDLQAPDSLRTYIYIAIVVFVLILLLLAAAFCYGRHTSEKWWSKRFERIWKKRTPVMYLTETSMSSMATLITRHENIYDDPAALGNSRENRIDEPIYENVNPLGKKQEKKEEIVLQVGLLD